MRQYAVIKDYSGHDGYGGNGNMKTENVSLYCALCSAPDIAAMPDIATTKATK
jgi:hypothetical protein